MHDRQVLLELLHGKETQVWDDAVCSGLRDVIQHHAPQAQYFIQTKAHRHRPLREVERALNRTTSKVRAKVEYAFLVIKRILVGQSTLSRTREEYQLALHQLRLGKPVYGVYGTTAPHGCGLADGTSRGSRAA